MIVTDPLRGARTIMRYTARHFFRAYPLGTITVHGPGSKTLVAGRSYTCEGFGVRVESLGGYIGFADRGTLADATHSAIVRHEQARHAEGVECSL